VEGTVGRRKAFDRGDFQAVGLDGEHGAAFDRLTVDMDDTGAALAGVAADMGACQAKVIAEQLHQKGASLDLARYGLAVNLQGNGWHRSLPFFAGSKILPFAGWQLVPPPCATDNICLI
jgi:hypothetical protein